MSLCAACVVLSFSPQRWSDTRSSIEHLILGDANSVRFVLQRYAHSALQRLIPPGHHHRNHPSQTQPLQPRPQQLAGSGGGGRRLRTPASACASANRAQAVASSVTGQNSMPAL